MTEQNHLWCRDVRRDEAVRAAEDAAAVPAIMHRDLPEQVALLWASLGDLLGRVVRLDGEMDAGQDEEADAASDEAVAHGATLSALAEARESLAAANRGIARLTAERDAAIRERDEARARVAELVVGVPRPRGWLTAEERAAVEEAMVDYASNVGDHDCERIERVLRALLARSTPPRVKVPSELMLCEARGVRIVYDAGKVKRAIRAAGGEVE